MRATGRETIECCRCLYLPASAGAEAVIAAGLWRPPVAAGGAAALAAVGAVPRPVTQLPALRTPHWIGFYFDPLQPATRKGKGGNLLLAVAPRSTPWRRLRCQQAIEFEIAARHFGTRSCASTHDSSTQLHMVAPRVGGRNSTCLQISDHNLILV